MNFHYHLNDNDSLTFRQANLNEYSFDFKRVNSSGYCFDLFTKGEATAEQKIATYKNNRWVFEDEQQRSKFLTLMLMDRKGFKRAVDSYFRSLNEKPTVWECAWRRFNIKITKTTRKLSNSFYTPSYRIREY